MIPTLLLTAGAALGQPGPPNRLPVDPPGVVRLDPAARPQVIATQVPDARPADEPPKPLDLTLNAPGTPPADPEPPAAPATAPFRYPFMRAVQGTWLGVLLDDNKIGVSGWTQFAYTGSTNTTTNLPVALNDLPDEFLVHQNYLHVERPVDPSARKFQLGFLSDWILPGSDFRYTLPRGLFNGQFTDDDGSTNRYGIDPFQFYASAFLPDVGPRGTKVIAGRFGTHIGYELVQAPDTPFLGRSYLFQYNPFTHTGVWATSQLTDAWSMGHGVVNGADTFIDPANRAAYIGQVKWAPPTGRTSVTFNTMITDPRYSEAEAFTFYNVYDTVVTHKLSERVGYVLNATYSHTSDAPDVGFADWYGAANYLSVQVAEKVSTVFRFELFYDSTGFRTGGRGLYKDVAAAVHYAPYPSLLIRPEIRYDHNDDSRPFEGKASLLTAALNVIVRW